MPGGDQFRDAHVLDHVAVEDGVEQRVVGLGGLLIEFSGIGGVSPRRAASELRQRASSQISVLGTSLMGPNPPAESP